jgi:hypothetical protein
MAKRFFSTEIWDEDWFIDMPMEYKLFWFYILSNCDHCGLFKVNLRSFCGLNGVKIDSDSALTYFNNGKSRIRVVNQSVWFIEDFFVYQYGTTLNLNNRVHESIKNRYDNIGIKLTSIRGLIDLKDRVKDKDKEIKRFRKNPKGGSGGTSAENAKTGIYYLEDFRVIVFDDETCQPLTDRQLEQLKNREIRPSDIFRDDTKSQNLTRATETAQISPQIQK